jgi:dihydrodipicolinate synthase/N-acetylneuraminate lyase
MLLEGIFPALTTPFYPDGRVYLKKLEHNVDRYSRTPVAGMVVLGSTGESVMMGDDETRTILKEAINAASPEKVMLAGIARESVLETLKLAEFAASHSYDAVLIRTPNYYAPQMGRREILNYYRTLADQSPLPILLYSIPKLTHYDMPVDVIAELAQHPNIIGLKDSSGNVERIAEVVAATSNAPRREVPVTTTFTAFTSRMQAAAAIPPVNFVSAIALGGEAALTVAPPALAAKIRSRQIGFQVLTGSGEKFLPSIVAGASGGVLGMATCAPQACQEIYTAWKDNDPKLAREKQERLIDASVLVGVTLGIAGIKYACDLNGYYGGRPRLPLLPLSAEQQDDVARAMADLRN